MGQLSSSMISRVGQNRIYTPYMTVYLVIYLPGISYMHRIYIVLANPIQSIKEGEDSEVFKSLMTLTLTHSTRRIWPEEGQEGRTCVRT